MTIEPVAQARYVLTLGEYLRAAAAGLSRRRAFLIGAAFLLAGLLLALSEGPHGTRWWLLVAAFLFGFLPALAIATWTLLYTRYRRMPAEQREIVWRFFDTHVEVATTVTSSRLEWAAFAGLLELRTFFLLNLQSVRTTVIPKRAFGSPAEIAALRRLAVEKLGRKARLRGES